jgi:3-isopropylmalate dehydrogenase
MPPFRAHVGRAGSLHFVVVSIACPPVPRTLGTRSLHCVSRSISLGVIPGDGIGPDIVSEGMKVLQAALPADVTVETETYDVGARRWHKTGEVLPDSMLSDLRQHDAIFFGAIGDPSVPHGILERGVLLRMRFEFDHYVNLRPCRLFAGVASPLADPGPIDFVVVREGTEGPYVGNGGAIRVGTPHEVATEVSVNTAYGIERLVRYGFTQAAGRPRRKLTLVHKQNVLVNAGGMWQRIVDRVAGEHPDVTVDYLHVDAATIFLVTNPGRFDVIVTDNLFGDIITDLAGAISGGVGLAASGNINPEGDTPSMFEPVHGSAPDIAGKGIADPTAAVLSAALMLEHLGVHEAAARISGAVETDLASRSNAWQRSTTEIGDALAALV